MVTHTLTVCERPIVTDRGRLWPCGSPMLLVVHDDVVVERCSYWGHIAVVQNVLPEQSGFLSWVWGNDDAM